jgi:predicted N-acyltransferase
MTKQHSESYSFAWIQDISEIDKLAWDSMAAALATPFLEWDWLRLMEKSGSTTAAKGWLPNHLTVWSGRDLVAAAPLYIKGHSAGEFVFDHIWADVAGRLGIAYYPKLVGMSPFTPMVGYRFLIGPEVNESELTAMMLTEIDRFCRRHGVSGCSFLFVDPQWRQAMINQGFLGWLHQSYSWQNHDYRTFDDYLAIFNANQRRNIRRERKAVARQGLAMKIFTGEQIARQLPALMYRYYDRTNDKFGPWGCRYLTPSFFDGLHRHFRHRLVLVAAFAGNDPGAPVGMSMLIRKGQQLYGRYWGCSRPIDALHFNACYYAPIEWAIGQGIQRFDPGAGGAHKIRRGFRAEPNYSLHRFYDPRLHRIMATHIGEINRWEQDHIDALNRELPLARPMNNEFAIADNR